MDGRFHWGVECASVKVVDSRGLIISNLDAVNHLFY
jgi:hypothetical protein